MDEKTTVLVNGQWLQATKVPITSSQERWSEHILEDGSVLRVKLVVSEVARIDGVYEADGTPVYNVKNNVVLAVSAPEKLKKRPGG